MSIPRRLFLELAVAQAAVARFDPRVAFPILPPKPANEWHVYDVGGQQLFPLFSSEGYLLTSSIMWLMRWDERRKEHQFVSIMFTAQEINTRQTEEEIKALVNAKLDEALRKAKDGLYLSTPDGGELRYEPA